CVGGRGTCGSVTNCAILSVNTLTTGGGPTDLLLRPGQIASFSTVASGTGPHTYQWRRQGVDMRGAYSPAYSIAPVSAADAATCCVVVNGTCNSLTNCATLAVNTPTMAGGPSDQVRCIGEPANLSVVASGTGPFTYQWSKDGADLIDATNASYSIASTDLIDAGVYCVTVSGICDSVTNCATLGVVIPVTAIGPSDLVRCPGQSASFATTASGTGPFSYQWRKDGVDIVGATDPSYTVAVVG